MNANFLSTSATSFPLFATLLHLPGHLHRLNLRYPAKLGSAMPLEFIT